MAIDQLEVELRIQVIRIRTQSEAIGILSSLEIPRSYLRVPQVVEGFRPEGRVFAPE